MHFVYIDDSKDRRLACFSALIIPADRWRDSLDWLLEARRALRDCHGIYITKEIHATDWNSGKGKIAKHLLGKHARVSFFHYLLSAVSRMPGSQLINAAMPASQEDRAFERLLNRINTNMSKAGSQAVIFCDEGKNYDGMLRRMRHFNPIPSRFGGWSAGKSTKNINLDRVLEDIVYRDSKRSLFIQAADWCAYAVLRNRNPIPSKTALGLDRSLEILGPICVKRANHKDPLGVIT